MKNKQISTGGPLLSGNNLLDQITSISKASAYDILVAQVKELKDENEMIKRLLSAATELNIECLGALNEISPLLDGLINRTETGTKRNELCHMNIRVKTALSKHDSK